MRKYFILFIFITFITLNNVQHLFAAGTKYVSIGDNPTINWSVSTGSCTASVSPNTTFSFSGSQSSSGSAQVGVAASGGTWTFSCSAPGYGCSPASTCDSTTLIVCPSGQTANAGGTACVSGGGGSAPTMQSASILPASGLVAETFTVSWSANGTVTRYELSPDGAGWIDATAAGISSPHDTNAYGIWGPNPSTGDHYADIRACNTYGCSGNSMRVTYTINSPSVSCTTPWGATVANGAPVTAYQTATVPYGNSCVSQTRTCNNGTLSGSYSNQSCTVDPPAGQPPTTPVVTISPSQGYAGDQFTVTYESENNPTSWSWGIDNVPQGGSKPDSGTANGYGWAPDTTHSISAQACNAYGCSPGWGADTYTVLSQPITGGCGTAHNGTARSSLPTTSSARCSSGTYTATDSIGSDGTLDWTCSSALCFVEKLCSNTQYWNGSSCVSCGNGGCTGCTASPSSPTNGCSCTNGGTPGTCTLADECGPLANSYQSSEPTGSNACTSGALNSSSPANTADEWKWTCGSLVCSAVKPGCNVSTDTNYSGVNPANNYNCALTCANGMTNYPTCTITDTCPNGATNYPTCTAAPIIISFTNNGPITSGNSATLTWTTSGATSCTIDQSIGSVSVNSSRSTGSLASSRTYTLSCTNAGGLTATQQTTVTITGSPTPQCSDGTDNDGDGKTDYPTDPGCSSSSDTDENALSGTLSASTATCTIASGASSCTAALTWTTTDPIGSSNIMRGGFPNPLYSTLNGTNQSVTVPYNSGIPVNFYLYNNSIELASVAVNSVCEGGSFWNTINCTPGPTADLIAGNVTPGTAVAGDSTQFSSTITNNGTGSTGASFYNFLQVATGINGAGTVTDVPAGSQMSAIAIAGSRDYTSSYTFPSGGTYSVRVCADKLNSSDGGTISESNEDNNCSSSWTNVTVSAPSAITLVMPDCEVQLGKSTCISKPSRVLNPVSGTRYRLKYFSPGPNVNTGTYYYTPVNSWTHNPTNAAAVGTEVELHHGPNEYNGNSISLYAEGQPNNVLDTARPIAKCAVGTTWSSAANMCIAVTYSCTNIPSNATLCPNDNTGLTGNTISTVVSSCTPATKCEYTCSNGYTNSGGVCVPAPSGTISATICTVPIGSNFCYSTTTGTVSGLAGTATINVSAGTLGTTYNNTNVSNGPYTIEWLRVYAAAGQGNQPTTFTLRDNTTSQVLNSTTVSASCVSGSAWDSTSNTCKELTSLDPDLIAGNVTPLTATAGTQLTLEASISNIGGGPTSGMFRNFFQYSTLANGGGSIVDIPYGSAVGPLVVGNSLTQSQSYTFPSSGTFYIRACADKRDSGNVGVITESNEDNNCSPTWSAITVSANGTAPSISSFSNSGPIVSGNSAILSWGLVSGTAPITCSIDNGLGIVSSAAGTISTGALFSQRTYTLTCTNAGGTATRSTTVSISGGVTCPAGNATYGACTYSYPLSNENDIFYGTIVSPSGYTGGWSQRCQSNGNWVSIDDYTRTGNRNSCDPPVCTGSVPENADACSGDTTGLSADTPISLVPSCTPQKCEYTCKSGYSYNGGICVIGGPKADLVAEFSPFATIPGTITAGTNQTIVARIRNVGGGNAGNFKTSFQVTSSADTSWTTPTQIGSLESSLNLNAGFTLATSRSYRFSNPGTYIMRICTDIDTEVEENDEDNNCAPNQTITVVSVEPDLTIGDVSPLTATQGTPQTFSARVYNNGGNGTVAVFSNFFQYSTQASGGGTITDIPAGSAVGPLAASDDLIYTQSYAFPSAGTFYMRGCADKSSSAGGDVINEGANEGNNCSLNWSQIIVTNAGPTPKPDLVIEAAPTLPATGTFTSPVTFSATVKNNGNQDTSSSFWTFFQVRNESDTDWNNSVDVTPPVVNLSLLARSATVVKTQQYTFATQGRYVIRACADKYNRDNNDAGSNLIDESNEDNNCSPESTVIEVTSPCTAPNSWNGSACVNPQVGLITVTGVHYYSEPPLDDEAIRFTCTDSTHYSLTKTETPPTPDTVFGPFAYTGPVVFQTDQPGRGDGFYTIRCINGSVEDRADPVEYDSSIPVAANTLIFVDSYPKTVNTGGKSALSWSITRPPVAAPLCKLTASPVCPNEECSTNSPEKVAANAVQQIINDGRVDGDANSPFIRDAVGEVARGQTGENAKALGKKTFELKYTTDFTINCGSGKKATTRVRVANSNEN